MFLIHRGHVIQPVEIRQVLQVRPAFHQFFSAAMQQADVGITALYNLTVQFQNQPQHPMRSRVLGTKVDVEIPDFLFAREGIVEITGAVHHASASFSSPGNTYCAPSHGDMKSNCRYS